MHARTGYRKSPTYVKHMGMHVRTVSHLDDHEPHIQHEEQDGEEPAGAVAGPRARPRVGLRVVSGKGGVARGSDHPPVPVGH